MTEGEIAISDVRWGWKNGVGGEVAARRAVTHTYVFILSLLGLEAFPVKGSAPVCDSTWLLTHPYFKVVATPDLRAHTHTRSHILQFVHV